MGDTWSIGAASEVSMALKSWASKEEAILGELAVSSLYYLLSLFSCPKKGCRQAKERSCTKLQVYRRRMKAGLTKVTVGLFPPQDSHSLGTHKTTWSQLHLSDFQSIIIYNKLLPTRAVHFASASVSTVNKHLFTASKDSAIIIQGSCLVEFEPSWLVLTWLWNWIIGFFHSSQGQSALNQIDVSFWSKSRRSNRILPFLY